MAIVLRVKYNSRRKRHDIIIKAVHGHQFVCNALKSYKDEQKALIYIDNFKALPKDEQDYLIATRIKYDEDGLPLEIDKNKIATKVRYHSLEQQHTTADGKKYWRQIETSPFKSYIKRKEKRFLSFNPNLILRVRLTSHRTLKINGELIPKKLYNKVKGSLVETYKEDELEGITNNVNKTVYKKKKKRNSTIKFWIKK